MILSNRRIGIDGQPQVLEGGRTKAPDGNRQVRSADFKVARKTRQSSSGRNTESQRGIGHIDKDIVSRIPIRREIA